MLRSQKAVEPNKGRNAVTDIEIYLHLTAIPITAIFFFVLIMYSWPEAYPICEGCDEVGTG